MKCNGTPDRHKKERFRGKTIIMQKPNAWQKQSAMKFYMGILAKTRPGPKTLTDIIAQNGIK